MTRRWHDIFHIPIEQDSVYQSLPDYNSIWSLRPTGCIALCSEMCTSLERSRPPASNFLAWLATKLILICSHQAIFSNAHAQLVTCKAITDPITPAPLIVSFIRCLPRIPWSLLVIAVPTPPATAPRDQQNHGFDGDRSGESVVDRYV